MAKSYKYKRSRKALTLDELKLRLTDAIKAAEKIILTGSTDDKKLRAIHAMVSAAGSYNKLVETTDLEKRIEELEQQAERGKR